MVDDSVLLEMSHFCIVRPISIIIHAPSCFISNSILDHISYNVL